MLGQRILDPLGVESNDVETQVLGLIPAVTTFRSEKMTKQIRAMHFESKIEVKGYEIHMGETQLLETLRPMFQVTKRGGDQVALDDGVSVQNGQIWGTYLHGIFDSSKFRTYFLNELRKWKKLPPLQPSNDAPTREQLYDRLADLVRSNIRLDLFYRILDRQLSIGV